MTDIVNPRPVRNMPPAPLDGDPPAVFDEKAKNLALWYDNWVSDNNNQAADNRQNAQATFELAQAADHSADQAHDYAQDASESVVAVNQTVADILAAKDAIQAGPVASVNGKTGVITGLVETNIGATRTKSQLMANAPIGQWSAYSDTTGVGADWPPGHPTVNWWNVFTYGTSIATGRVTQRASQTLNTGYQGWIFERQLHDTTWGPWHRVLTDRTLIESVKHHGPAAPAYTVDPSVATVNWVEIFNAVTINVPNPRAFGDQLTILFSMVSASPITFSNNVKLPVGGVPAPTANTIMTIALIARFDNVWDLHVGGVNPW